MDVIHEALLQLLKTSGFFQIDERWGFNVPKKLSIV
jgi:hypothetical protein